MPSRYGSAAAVCHLRTADLDCPAHSPAWNIWLTHDLLELELDCSPEVAKGKTYFRQGTVELHITVNILQARNSGNAHQN